MHAGQVGTDSGQADAMSFQQGVVRGGELEGKQEGAGFHSVRESAFRQSRIPDIDQLEPGTLDKMMVTLYVKAEKP